MDFATIGYTPLPQLQVSEELALQNIDTTSPCICRRDVTTNNKDIEILNAFERTAFHRIIGPVCNKGRWSRKDNTEIYKDQPVRRLIKSTRLILYFKSI